MVYGIWSVLIVIAVCDARECKIPNKFVLLLFLLVLLHLESAFGGISEIPIQYFYGGGISFLVCFALYLGRLMGAGDVKLIAVIGLLVGLKGLGNFALAVILAGSVQSIFYLAFMFAGSNLNLRQHVNQYISHNVYGRLTRAPVRTIQMRVPFAPAIVAALALYPLIG